MTFPSRCGVAVTTRNSLVTTPTSREQVTKEHFASFCTAFTVEIRMIWMVNHIVPCKRKQTWLVPWNNNCASLNILNAGTKLDPTLPTGQLHGCKCYKLISSFQTQSLRLERFHPNWTTTYLQANASTLLRDSLHRLLRYGKERYRVVVNNP